MVQRFSQILQSHDIRMSFDLSKYACAELKVARMRMSLHAPQYMYIQARAHFCECILGECKAFVGERNERKRQGRLRLRVARGRMRTDRGRLNEKPPRCGL